MWTRSRDSGFGITGWVQICPVVPVSSALSFIRYIDTYEEVEEIIGRDVVREVLDEEGTDENISKPVLRSRPRG